MSGYLTSNGVDPTKTRSAYKELADLNAKYGELATDAGLAAAGALPPPFGTAADVASLGRSLWKGNWGDALLDVVGIIPIVGDAAKAGKVAKRLNDLRRSMDVAATTLGKSLQSTKKAAKQYWAAMKKAQKAEYDKAIKNCKTKACRDKKAALKGPQYGYTPTDGPNGKWKGERGESVWQPSNGGPAVKYNNGFPDYGPHSKGDVEIAMRGNETTDFTAARNAMRERTGDPNWTTPKNMTWHHKEDGVTMQLIPKSVHATGGGASTPHMGGASLYSGSNANGF